jgi:coenzyme F420-0:L-glutamate ligase/coenzyme F420-1:gamma-L-glutamate ligase
MEILPLKTSHIIRVNENILDVLEDTLTYNKIHLQERDVIVITEKVAALCQGRIKKLSQIQKISTKAQKIAQEYQLDPRLVQMVSDEASHIFGGVQGMLLTVNSGILIANAGIDHSNAGLDDTYILWPSNPYQFAEDIVTKFKVKFHLKEFGISISDSRVQPMKRGVVGVSIGVAGFEPIEDCRGRKDLFGYKMQFKVRAIADQMTDAAILVMCECDEQTPFAIVRNAPVTFTSVPIDPSLMVMPMNDDLFVQILTQYDKHKLK